MRQSFIEFMEERNTNLLEAKAQLREEVTNHISTERGVFNNDYRLGSEQFFNFIMEAREMYKEGIISLHEADKEVLRSDIGEWAEYTGEHVPLDLPMYNEEYIDEAEYKGRDVELNKPMKASGSDKPYKVYVKTDDGNVSELKFGSSGLKAKINDKEARKNFASRHNCDQKNDKTKAGYWSCRLPYYADQLGLSGGGQFFW